MRYAVRSETSELATPANPVDLLLGTQTVYLDNRRSITSMVRLRHTCREYRACSRRTGSTDKPIHVIAIRIRSAVTPWSHVRTMGEDIVTTQLVLPAGHTLRPVDLGAIAASGHDIHHCGEETEDCDNPNWNRACSDRTTSSCWRYY